MAMNFKEFKENINGKKVAVVGIGISNIPLIKKLVEYGCKISRLHADHRPRIRI